MSYIGRFATRCLTSCNQRIRAISGFSTLPTLTTISPAKVFPGVVVTQVPLHGIRLSQRELHQMNVPVKVESENASIRNDEDSASLVKSVKAQIASNWL